MRSLKYCIELSGLHPIEAKALQSSAKSYRDEGFSARESNTSAVKDHISDLESKRKDIVEQIRGQIPEAFKAPVQPIEDKAGQVSIALVEKQKRVKDKIERLKNRIDQAEKTSVPGTFITGREGVSKTRARRLDAQLDKRIDRAVEIENLKKELTQIEAQVEAQKEAPKKEALKEKVKARSEEQFDAIKAGDQIDVGGNNLLTVIKKNPKSVKTEHGGTWRADEIVSVIPKREPVIKPTDPMVPQAVVRKPPVKPTVYSTTATNPAETITRKQIRGIFDKMKNVSTGLNKAGNLYVKAKGFPAIEILEVDHIEGFVQTSAGRIAVGSYLENKIELKTGGEGAKADIGTLFHEFGGHFFEENGIITANDIKALNAAIGDENATKEDRANYIGDNLADRHSQKNLRIKRILRKIADFMNAFYEMVWQTRTARGVLAGISSGAILEEKKSVLEEINEFAQEISFSLKEAAGKITDNPNFVKWFKGSKVLDKNGEPLLLYHGTSKEFTKFKQGWTYLTDSVDYAKQISGRRKSEDLMEVYASIKNPFDIRKIPAIKNVTKTFLSKFFKEHGVNLDTSLLGEPDFIYWHLRNNEVQEIIMPQLIALGYDGIIFNDVIGSDQKTEYKNIEATSYVTFKPTQIKSIYNTGAFSPTDPDIRYQAKGGYKDLLEAYRKEQAEKTKPKPYEPTTSVSGFQETLEPVTDQDYIDNRKTSKSLKVRMVTNAKRVRSEIAETADQYFGSISTRLGNISTKLKNKLRRLDFDTTTKNSEYVKAVMPLLKKAKKMEENDLSDWDYARKNSDVDKIDSLVTKYKLQEEYLAYREALDKLRKEALDTGLVIGEIEEYAPRILKDSKGFLTAIKKNDEWPVFSRKIEERAKELDIKVEDMHPDIRADIISNMILTGQTGLGGVPATKQRKLLKIPARLNRYYMDSDAALMQHIYGMTKLIEARKFFGKIPEKVVEMRKRLYAVQAKVRELNNLLKGEKDNNVIIETKKERNEYIELEKQYTAYLTKYALQRDYRENIGVYIDELIIKREIKPRDERRVKEILNARFHEHGARGLFQAYKNFSYIDTMGSPISALTQIGDLAWAMYEGGAIPALKHAYKAAIKQSKITKEDVGVSRIAQEFADSGTLGNAVSKAFKIVGLEKIDSIGKESLLNTALEKYQTRAKEEPAKLKKEIRSIFELETDSVIEDLVNKEISENVKLLVYSRLLDFQPVALSEMPQKYLEAGNGRLFYMLKTFTLKVFDIFRNESYNKIKKGDKTEKIQGMKNLVRLAMFFVLANAGADELKDFVLNRKTDFEDRVVDNILRLFGVSKFITWKARTEGVGSALARQILPPFKFIDSTGKDIINAGDERGLELLASVPIVGKLAYWHIGRGASKREDLWDRRLRKYKAKLNEVQDAFERSKDKAVFLENNGNALTELRLVNKFQGRLNLDRKRINKLKSLPETKELKKSIQRLEKERTDKIRRWLKRERL